jgi:hypothetical protein
MLLQVNAVLGEDRLQPPAEAIAREPSEVGDRPPEAADRARGVERAAAGIGLQTVVGALEHEVVQRLAADQDHGRGSARSDGRATQSRGLGVIGSTWSAGL